MLPLESQTVSWPKMWRTTAPLYLCLNSSLCNQCCFFHWLTQQDLLCRAPWRVGWGVGIGYSLSRDSACMEFSLLEGSKTAPDCILCEEAWVWSTNTSWWECWRNPGELHGVGGGFEMGSGGWTVNGNSSEREEWHQLPSHFMFYFRSPLIPKTKWFIDFCRTGCLEASCQRCSRNVWCVWHHHLQPALGVSSVWVWSVCGLLSDEEEKLPTGWELTWLFSKPLILLN